MPFPGQDDETTSQHTSKKIKLVGQYSKYAVSDATTKKTPAITRPEVGNTTARFSIPDEGNYNIHNPQGGHDVVGERDYDDDETASQSSTNTSDGEPSSHFQMNQRSRGINVGLRGKASATGDLLQLHRAALREIHHTNKQRHLPSGRQSVSPPIARVRRNPEPKMSSTPSQKTPQATISSVPRQMPSDIPTQVSPAAKEEPTTPHHKMNFTKIDHKMAATVDIGTLVTNRLKSVDADTLELLAAEMIINMSVGDAELFRFVEKILEEGEESSDEL